MEGHPTTHITNKERKGVESPLHFWAKPKRSKVRKERIKERGRATRLIRVLYFYYVNLWLWIIKVPL